MPGKPFPKKNELVVTALSLVRREGGWAVAIYKIVGNEIVETTYTDVDTKALAQEQFKIKCVKDIFHKVQE